MHSNARARWGALGLVLAVAATAAAANLGPSSGDAEAYATVIAIDSAEIIHADLAMTKKLSDPVLAYVQDIRGEHADDAEEIADEAEDAGVYPARTVAVRALETEADEVTRKLDELDGAEFEKAYLDATIKCHTAILATIDRLLKLELSAGVKTHVREMRPNAEKHISKARALRK